MHRGLRARAAGAALVALACSSDFAAAQEQRAAHPGKAVYELNEGQHHDHLVCLDCGRVEEFFDPEIEKRQQMIAKTRGFVLQEHALSLYATCSKADCPHRATPADHR